MRPVATETETSDDNEWHQRQQKIRSEINACGESETTNNVSNSKKQREMLMITLKISLVCAIGSYW